MLGQLAESPVANIVEPELHGRREVPKAIPTKTMTGIEMKDRAICTATRDSDE